MRVVSQRLEGPVTIDESISMRGMITGHATISAGHFILHGVVTGDLIVKAGARATIYGQVYGTVLNDGGQVEIEGSVGALADTSPLSRTLVSREAVVNGLA